eukprot:GDKJ01013602.1.p1 GENE.GDKJ01013602.1~~GDKJ01013602.1.p1  ORF type:complete len:230 (-),score=47.89 GDKJ01013602.1:47-736(-)
MSVQDAKLKLNELKAIADRDSVDIEKCKQLLQALKVAVARLPNACPLFGINSLDVEQALIARETFEYGAFICIRDNDNEGFALHYQQLKPYYFDFAGKLPVSDKQYPTIGMYLLYLLSEDRIGEFHVELELIPEAEKSNMNNRFIFYPIRLEECLMEGNYHRIYSAREEAPLPMFLTFTDALISRVRVAENKDASLTDGEGAELTRDDVQAVAFLSNYLNYAAEIERIV